MKEKHIMDTTDNPSVWKKAYRAYLDTHHRICMYCPPNKGENATSWRYARSWKKHRKTQYRKIKDV